MVRVWDSSIFQVHTAGKPPDSNCFEPKRQGFATSCVNPKTAVSPALSTTFPGYAFTGNLYLNPKETNSAYSLPPYRQALFPASITSLKPKALEASHEHGGNGSFQKKFLVFDRSKNGTRLIFGGPPVQNPDTFGRKQCGDFHANNEDELGINLTLDLNRSVLEEECDEHHIVEEESEMHEDTEEINALLYSDGDDDDGSGDYESDEDEVTSTGHTPSSIMLELCGKHEQFDETEDKGGPNKRRKLLSGASIDNLLPPPIKTALSKMNGSSEHGNGATAANLSIGMELSKRDKISQTLKILENIVPGAEGKDPVVILDGAIDYLKAMKIRAQVIGKNLH